MKEISTDVYEVRIRVICPRVKQEGKDLTKTDGGE